MNSSPSASRHGDTSDLFDQSGLSDLAQRLVDAAKRAGADAADAIAVREVAQARLVEQIGGIAVSRCRW